MIFFGVFKKVLQMVLLLSHILRIDQVKTTVDFIEMSEQLVFRFFTRVFLFRSLIKKGFRKEVEEII